MPRYSWADTPSYSAQRKNAFKTALEEYKKQAMDEVAQKNRQADIAYAQQGQQIMHGMSQAKNIADSNKRAWETALQLVQGRERQREWDAQVDVSEMWRELGLEIRAAEVKAKTDNPDVSAQQAQWLGWEKAVQKKLDSAVSKGDENRANMLMQYMKSGKQGFEQAASTQELADKGLVSQKETEAAGFKTSTTPLFGARGAIDKIGMAISSGQRIDTALSAQAGQYQGYARTTPIQKSAKDYWAESNLEVQAAGFPLPDNAIARAFTRSGKMFLSGIGNSIESLGGAALALGFDGSSWVKSGRDMRAGALEDIKEPIGKLQQFTDSVWQSMPFMLTGMLTAAAVTLGGPYLGLGVGATWVWTSLWGAAVSRTHESMVEAGGSYIEARQRGKSHEEGQQAFTSVAQGNMAMVGWDATQIAVAFMPMPARVIASPLLRTLAIGGKVVVVGLSEGGEEVYQEWLQRKAQGDPFYWKPNEWDEQTRMAFAVGTFMGGMMGAGGDVISRIGQETRTRLSEKDVKKFTASYEGAIKEGKTETEAIAVALDETAKSSPEAAARIAESIAAVQEAQVESVEATPQQAPSTEIQGTEEEYDGREFLYHGTLARSIEAIKRSGLQSNLRERNDWEEGDRGPQEQELIYFERSENKNWGGRGGVQLRVDESMLPSGVSIGEDQLRRGEFYATGRDYFEIPPEAIEFYDKKAKTWRPIAEYGTQPTPQQTPVAETTQEAPTEDLLASTEARSIVEAELETAKKGLRESTTEQQKIVGRQEVAKLEKELAEVTEIDNMQRRADALNSNRAKKLRSTIMAWAKMKGLTKAQLEATLKDFSEENPNEKRKSAIRLTQYTESELEALLPIIREARPKRVGGKTVVTRKTEGKVRKLKANLTKKGQMTDADYARIMQDLGLKTDKYEDGKRFITEKEGRDLLKAMLDESEYIARRTSQEQAVEASPEIAKVIKEIEGRSPKSQPKSVWGQVLEDMRYLFQDLERQSGKPFFDAWNWLNEARLNGRYKFEGYFAALSNATKNFGEVAASKESQERIRQWLASDILEEGKAPELSADELAVAQKMREQLDSLKGLIRYLKVREAYQVYGNDPIAVRDNEIRNAPVTDLRKAFDIYETQGREGLIAFLADKDWGVIRHGYSPEEFIRPHVSLKGKERPTSLGKGHLKVREGIAFGEHEQTLLQQYSAYLRQVLRLEVLDAPIRHMVRTFDEAQLANRKDYAGIISGAIHEAKGYRDSGSFASRALARMYGQVIQAVFLDPAKWLRNKFQNPAFHTGAWQIARLDNKHLSPQQELYFKTYVSQKMGMIHDYLMQGQKPLPGLGRITELAKQVNIYPLTDETNRMESFYVSINQARRAVESYQSHKDVNRLLKESGADVLEPLQQRDALRLLAQPTVTYGIEGIESVSGEEAFARDIGREVTNNVHFMYDRAERSAFEHGEGGVIIGNLMAFSRGTAQRVALQARKVKNGRTFNEKWMGMRTIAHMIVVGFLVGEAYRRLTGRKYNPYNLLNIWQWTPGGLSMGAAQEAGALWSDLMYAVQGDRDALGRLTTALPRAGTLFIPFYDFTIEALEALTDKKNIDTYALRKIRDAIDEEYKVRDSAYNIKRDFVEKMQHALFGGEVSEEQQKEAPKPTGLDVSRIR